MAKETILRNADLITSWFCNSSSKSARKNVASSIAPNASTSSETPDDENDDCDYTDYTISIYLTLTLTLTLTLILTLTLTVVPSAKVRKIKQYSTTIKNSYNNNSNTFTKNA